MSIRPKSEEQRWLITARRQKTSTGHGSTADRIDKYSLYQVPGIISYNIIATVTVTYIASVRHGVFNYNCRSTHPYLQSVTPLIAPLIAVRHTPRVSITYTCTTRYTSIYIYVAKTNWLQLHAKCKQLECTRLECKYSKQAATARMN